MASSQQASWETNTYVVATTRVFMVFGVTYLVRTSYQLYRKLKASNDSTVVHDRAIEAEEANVGFELALNDISSGSAAAFGLEDVTGIEEMVEIRRPLPVHYPGGPNSQ